MSLVQRFAQNTRGRDFVVGDVHGCFDYLRAMLEHVQLDEVSDRLFCVGDLVDRGPQSEEAIDWVAKPWFHAVRGNHEQMTIDIAAGRHDRDNYQRNGGGWFLALSEDRRKAVAEVLDTLPVAIEIETADGPVGIVHAEIPMEWPTLLELLEGHRSISKSMRRNIIEVCLWSRERITKRDGRPIEGVARVYVGHTPLSEPVVLGNVVYVDTGIVYGHALTMINLAEPRLPIVMHQKPA
jgi:serine/threonine protein phosphatase 1